MDLVVFFFFFNPGACHPAVAMNNLETCCPIDRHVPEG